jgi:hypothetical protein
MAKANIKKLDKLHDVLATYYGELLEEGERLSSGELAALNAFLKNNNVTADVTDSSPMQSLSLKIKDMIKETEDA